MVCSAANWLEMTNLIDYYQYSTTPDSNNTGVPNPLPAPWSLSASDAKAPSWAGTCFAASPNAPSNCTDNCLVYLDLWGANWIEFGELNCAASYPEAGVANFTSPKPPPGNVFYTMSKTSKNYFYDNLTWGFVVTDTFGAKYQLQTTQSDTTPTDEEWASNLQSVVWPEGWVMENVTYATNQTQVPWVDDNGDAWNLIIKDSNENAWHQFEYPPLGSPLMVDKNPCLNYAQHVDNGTASSVAPGPVPADAPASMPPTSTSSPNAAPSTAPTSSAFVRGFAQSMVIALVLSFWI